MAQNKNSFNAQCHDDRETKDYTTIVTNMRNMRKSWEGRRRGEREEPTVTTLSRGSHTPHGVGFSLVRESGLVGILTL
jgi:hypothetical protein